VIVWILFLKSGIHATIAGVLLALTIPLRRKTDTRSFYERGKQLLDDFLEECNLNEQKTVLSKKQLHAIDDLQELTENTTSPLQHLEHALHGWVSYVIMPVFAFANAGVIFSFGGDSNLALSMNIALSMVIGNVIGIFASSWLAIKFDIAELPENVNFKQLAGVSFLGGLGFTMSLFINNLAYSDAALIDSAKMGILLGSMVAGLLGYFTIRLTVKNS
jgi:NhaA family Na+:H+ antiporter